MAWLKSEIKKQFLKDGNKMYMQNAKAIAEYLSSNKVVTVNSNNIDVGQFYFIFNDLKGKSSKMEQFVPCIYLGDIDSLEGNKLLCLSFNFIPVAIRTILLDQLLQSYDNNIIKDNLLETSIKNEKPYSNITFDKAYKALKSIGFEYTVREILAVNVNKVVKISIKDLVKFVTMNTYLFTGVPEDKLAQIWLAKLKDREKREQEFLKNLLGDYDKMTKEIKSSISEQRSNIDKSIININNIINSK